MARLIAPLIILCTIGALSFTLYDAARRTVHHAQHARSVAMLCAESEVTPAIRAETRADIEAYLYACKGN
jgi:hypothetical protein